MSKTGYRTQNPDHEVVFNAYLVSEQAGTVWWGDLDLTLDLDEVKRFAAQRNEALLVLREADGLSEPPRIQRFVAHVMPDGTVIRP